jgi:hypothetical protein
MSNTLLTSSVIAKEALRVLENNLVFVKSINRKYEKEYDGDRKVGDTITIRKPAKYTVRSGAVISVQDHTETSTTLQLSNQKGVDVQFSSKELTLSLDDFSKQVLQPQIASLANQIDFDGLSFCYKTVPNHVGTFGTTATTLKAYLQAGQKLDENAAPIDDNRSVIVTPAAQVEIVDALKGLFQSSSEVKSQYEKGRMGTAGGLDWNMSQNLPTHTIGTLGGTPLVNGASQTGASLVTDGWTAAAANRLKQGDIFTIANVNAVNPQNGQSTGALRQFVVTADVASDGSGNATIPIYPSIVTSGAGKTVNAGPADNAALTIFGTTAQTSPTSLVMHKDAFTMATADLPLPNNMDMASRASSKQVGLAIRFIRGYDITNDLFVSRLDVLYGFAALYPEWACRMPG